MKKIIVRWDAYGFSVWIESDRFRDEVYRMGHNMESRLPLPQPMFREETLMQMARSVAARTATDYGIAEDIKYIGPSEEAMAVVAKATAFHHAGRG